MGVDDSVVLRRSTGVGETSEIRSSLFSGTFETISTRFEEHKKRSGKKNLETTDNAHGRGLMR